jgi:hypothetical protein
VGAVEELVAPSLIKGLPEIEKAAGKASFKALTPVFKKLKGKYTFDELRLARLLLSR